MPPVRLTALLVIVFINLVGFRPTATDLAIDASRLTARTAVTVSTTESAIISGKVTSSYGAPLAGVTLNLSGARTARAITDVHGNYRFTNVNPGNLYTLSPSLVNYHFNPPDRAFLLPGNETDVGFIATFDAAIGGNAIDSSGFFVRQHYLDFLGREPDDAGFNFWTNEIISCGADSECIERRMINVSAAYFLSIEFQQTGGFVDGVCRASYGRAPRFTEFMHDTATVAEGVVVGNPDWSERLATNKQAYLVVWIQRPEFQAAYGGLSNEAYVDTLLSDTGITFTPGERDALVVGLNNNAASRAEVLGQIAENERFVSAKRNATFVMMQYFGYLRRDPDESGYQFWLDKLNQFGGNFEQAEMVKAFLRSGEYRSRFVPINPGTSAVMVDLNVADITGVGSGTPFNAWRDSSGSGNDATLVDSAKPFTLLLDDEDGLPFVTAVTAGTLFSVPITATATKTVFVVLRHFPDYPLISSPPLYFSSTASVYGNYETSRYGGYLTNLGGGTLEGGYNNEWGVICWKQNGASVTLFANGVQWVTFTLSAASATTTLRIGDLDGPSTQYRQLVGFSTILSDEQILNYSKQLLQQNSNGTSIDYLDAQNSATFANPAQAIFIRKPGFPGLRPLVIFDHAAGETERQFRDRVEWRMLVNAAVDAGYVVGFSRQHNISWGNNDSLADNEAIYNYAVAHYAVDPARVAIVGDSMGGVAAMLSFAAPTSIPLKGAALYYPVQDVSFQHDYKIAMGVAIDAAYGGSFALNGAGHNPVRLSNSTWAGKRFIWFASTLDTLVPYEQNTEAMRTLIAGVATENTFVELNANHNNPTAIMSTRQALLDFLARCFQ
jgi:hypothetical protein